MGRLAPPGDERGLFRAPQGIELEEKRKIKNKGMGLFVLQEQNTGLSHLSS